MRSDASQRESKIFGHKKFTLSGNPINTIRKSQLVRNLVNNLMWLALVGQISQRRRIVAGAELALVASWLTHELFKLYLAWNCQLSHGNHPVWHHVNATNQGRFFKQFMGMPSRLKPQNYAPLSRNFFDLTDVAENAASFNLPTFCSLWVIWLGLYDQNHIMVFSIGCHDCPV